MMSSNEAFKILPFRFISTLSYFLSIVVAHDVFVSTGSSIVHISFQDDNTHKLSNI